MKILNLSLDKKILDKNSAVSARIFEYGNLVERYVVVAPTAKNKIVALWDIYKKAKKILAEEKGGKFNIITIQDQYYLALVGWFLAKKFKIGLELQVHGFEKYRGLRKFIARFVIPKADSIRCVSRRLENQLISEFRVSEEKITVVPIFTKIKAQELKGKSQNEKDKFIFLTVGRLEPVKNISLQIEAIAEIAIKYPNVELWIIGKGSEEEKLKSKSRKLKIENNVNFLGWHDDVNKFYSQADVFLLTSNNEGWGLVAIEAASFGLPIIITDVGCVGEVIINDQSGLVIPVGGKEELKNAMIKIMEGGGLRKRIGDQARKNIKNMPTKEETFALYKKSWEKAAGIKMK